MDRRSVCASQHHEDDDVVSERPAPSCQLTAARRFTTPYGGSRSKNTRICETRQRVEVKRMIFFILLLSSKTQRKKQIEDDDAPQTPATCSEISEVHCALSTLIILFRLFASSHHCPPVLASLDNDLPRLTRK